MVDSISLAPDLIILVVARHGDAGGRDGSKVGADLIQAQ